MHVAICDDNVADRRQLERLLKRESDKRSADTARCQHFLYLKLKLARLIEHFNEQSALDGSVNKAYIAA